MGSIFSKLFTKKESVDRDRLIEMATRSFEHAQLDKHLLRSVLKDPDANGQFLKSLSAQLLLQQDDFHTLIEEINNLKDYVNTFTSSSEETIFNKMIVDIQNGEIKLPVFILFPLVQNAFIWGYNTLEKYPIRMRIRVTSDFLKLEVSNRVNHYISNQADNDIIRNFKARLDLIYPQSHSLLINSNTNIFKATLTINFVRFT